MIMDDPNNGNLRQRMENNKSLASRFTEEELLAELASRQNKILGNDSNPVQKDEDEDKVDVFTPDQGKPASEIKFEQDREEPPKIDFEKTPVVERAPIEFEV